MKIKYLFLLIFSSSLLTSCFEDADDYITPASNLEINNFIYRGLNFFYLYKDSSPKLRDDAFADETARQNFLSGFDTPEDLFEYLKVPQDRFSRLYSDYRVIEDALAGVSLSNGMEYGLVYYPDRSGRVFGYVRYVLPNTDAAAKGLKRGDLFTTIDGAQLNENNYKDLLAQNAYTVGLATFDGNNFHPTGTNVPLTKIEYDENPVYIKRILNVNNQKIGYLMYNSFTRNYDSQLNNAFAEFKNAGVTDLVLDLRYNGGGSVETATDLASMITGQFNGQLFYKEFWNTDRQAEYASNGVFDNTISNGNATNSLNLSRVYILTTRNTASASELVLNGLTPYINTVQIGDTTTGKFQASFLLYDAPAPQFSKREANTNHRYVMLPLVFKTANKAGKTDYVDGLFPEIALKENYFNLGELGDPEEPFLATALGQITGVPRNNAFRFKSLTEFSGSEQASPLHGIMVKEQKD